MEFFQHIINKDMDIQNVEEIQSVQHWMSYRGFETLTDMCNTFTYMLDKIHNHSEYKEVGLRFVLKFGTMNKLSLFIKWMLSSMTDSTFDLYDEDVLALTRKQFNNFRQEGMIMMTRGQHHHLLFQPHP